MLFTLILANITLAVWLASEKKGSINCADEFIICCKVVSKVRPVNWSSEQCFHYLSAESDGIVMICIAVSQTRSCQGHRVIACEELYIFIAYHVKIYINGKGPCYKWDNALQGVHYQELIDFTVVLVGWFRPNS